MWIWKCIVRLNYSAQPWCLLPVLFHGLRHPKFFSHCHGLESSRKHQTPLKVWSSNKQLGCRQPWITLISRTVDQWIHYHLKFTFYSRTPPHYGFMENLLFESFFLIMFTSKVMPNAPLRQYYFCLGLTYMVAVFIWKYLLLFQLQDYRLLQNCHVAVTFLISLSGFSCLAIKGLTPAVC